MQIGSTTLWDFPKQNYLLQRHTKKGDLVVDHMCGSGTTIDVAKELNRKVIGYDLNIVRPDDILTMKNVLAKFLVRKQNFTMS